MNMKSISEFLKSLRKNQGLTQNELANKLNVSNKTISKWENGLGIPEMSSLLMLADFYQVSVDEILRGERKVIIENPIVENNDNKRLLMGIENKTIICTIISLMGLLLLFLLPSILQSTLLSIIIALILELGVFGFYFVTLRILFFQIQMLPFKQRQEEYSKIFPFHVIVLVIILLTIINAIFYFKFIPVIPSFEQGTKIFILSTIMTLTISSGVSIIVKLHNRYGIYIKKNILHIFVLFTILITLPVLLFSIVNSKKIAVFFQSPMVIESVAWKNEQYERYLEMKFLALIDDYEKQGMDSTTLYELNMNPNNNRLELYYTSEELITIIIDYEWFMNELKPRYQMGFTITNEYASAIWFDSSDDEIFNRMYLSMTAIFLFVGCLGYFIIRYRKKG